MNEPKYHMTKAQYREKLESGYAMADNMAVEVAHTAYRTLVNVADPDTVDVLVEGIHHNVKTVLRRTVAEQVRRQARQRPEAA